MNFVKSAALFATTSAFRFVLFFGIILLAMLFVFGNEQVVKSQLASTGLYDQFVNSVIADNQKIADTNSLPLDNPNIRRLINESFPPELLQQNSELVIDSFYAWLKSETEQPLFMVDFTENRQQLADKLATYAFDTLRTKPTCFAIPEEFDPFTAGCQPPSTNLGIEQLNLSAAIAGSEGILPDATFTNEDLPKNSDGQLITEKYSSAPDIFQWINRAPWIFGILLLGLAIAIIGLHHSKRRGVQQIGYAIVGSGAALLVTPLLLLYVLPRFSNNLEFSQTNSATQNLVNNAGNQLAANLYNQLINITLQIIVAGIIILLVERFTRPSARYLNIRKNAGIISSYKRKTVTSKKPLRADSTPVQSSEESKRCRPKRTKNKKYRKISKKEI